MAGVNKVILVGNIGKDPEVRFTADGKAIANLTLATSETWKDQQGQKQERTEWHRIAVFGGIAEIVQKYVHKGSKVYFEGKLQTRKWTDNQGQDRYTTEVVVDGFKGVMQMLDSKPSDGATQQPAQSRPAPPPEPTRQGAFNKNEPPVDDLDDTIPF